MNTFEGAWDIKINQNITSNTDDKIYAKIIFESATLFLYMINYLIKFIQFKFDHKLRNKKLLNCTILLTSHCVHEP